MKLYDGGLVVAIILAALFVYLAGDFNATEGYSATEKLRDAYGETGETHDYKK